MSFCHEGFYLGLQCRALMKCHIQCHSIWVFSVCQGTCLSVSRMKRKGLTYSLGVKISRLSDLFRMYTFCLSFTRFYTAHQVMKWTMNFLNIKFVIIFLPISLNLCFLIGQKDHPIETVLLSSCNICFD